MKKIHDLFSFRNYIITNVFPKRLKELRENSNLTQSDLVKKIDLSTTQSLSNYEKGRRKPDLETIILMARTFNVSTDYLLGNSDVSTPDPDIRMICEYLGLDEHTVYALRQIVEDIREDDYDTDCDKSVKMQIINRLLSDNSFLLNSVDNIRQEIAIKDSSIVNKCLPGKYSTYDLEEIFDSRESVAIDKQLKRQSRIGRFESTEEYNRLIESISKDISVLSKNAIKEIQKSKTAEEIADIINSINSKYLNTVIREYFMGIPLFNFLVNDPLDELLPYYDDLEEDSIITNIDLDDLTGKEDER